MSQHTIHYRFRFDDGQEYAHQVSLDPDSLADTTPLPEPLPEWAALECRQCPHCPLDSYSHPYCPFAARMAPLLTAFSRVHSCDSLELTVDDGRRYVQQRVSVQHALGSLLGLVCASSGCPYGVPFRPLARFHLPLASPEETLFRVVGAELIRQLLEHGQVSQADLDGLNRIYSDIHRVNVAMANRLRTAVKTDAAVNAIVILDMFANYVPASLEEMLAELRTLFATPKDDG